MAGKSTPSKKAQRAKNRSRPISTTALSEPLVAETSTAASFSAFSKSGLFFAHIALAVDKHRLRVFDTESGKSIAESVFQNSRVSTVHWTSLPSSGTDSNADAEAAGDESSSRKRKKRKSVSGRDVSTEDLIVIGFSNGTLAIFSPRQGEIVRTLSTPSSNDAILSITSRPTSQNSSSSELWSSSVNGSIYSWDARTGKLLATWKISQGTNTPHTAIAIHPSATDDNSPHILAARHRIQLFGGSHAETDTPREYAHTTGHASPVISLDWAPPSASDSAQTFISAAEGDRFACIWQLPEPDTEDDEEDDEHEVSEGILLASIPFDTEVRAIGYASPSSPAPLKPLAYGLSSSGELRVFAAPSASSVSSTGKPEPLTSVEGTRITTPTGSPPIVSACFDMGHPGYLQLARLVAGVRPVFDRIEFFTKEGTFVPDIKLKSPPTSQLPGVTEDKVLPTQRYKESNDTAIRSGAEVVAVIADDAAQDGTLDVSLAELSLGQRLASTSKSGQFGSIDHPDSQRNKQEGTTATRATYILKADAPTLTRTLTQALHSNDTPLLESVLANSSRQLIAGTVQRLQPQYAVPLIMACVERMNRGARAGRGKGRGGGAGAQRAELMVRWIRAVLVAHTAHLMTVPDLVTRLSALHTSLTQRLALQGRLLSLNGRLDFILSQIEHRAAVAPPIPAKGPQSTTTQKPKGQTDKKRGETFKYVEGESSDEAEAAESNAMDVDPNVVDEEDEETEFDAHVEEAEDEGSIEDVELGASDGESDLGANDHDEADYDSEGDEDYEADSPRVNGFPDIEAEESSGEGESASEDESDE